MAGLDAATILLLTVWTAWLLAALSLLGYDRHNVLLLLVFVTLGVVLGIWAHFPWRGYLMMWLGVHLLVVSLNRDSDAWRQYPLAVVSAGGVFWLWGQGGWPHARPVLTGVVIAVIAAAVAASGFGACWLYVVRPLRDRADRLGAQADQLPVVTARAVSAERSAAQAESLLASEREERRQAAAASLRRIGELQTLLRDEEEKRDLQRRHHEQDEGRWDRTREKLSGALREEREHRGDGDDPDVSGVADADAITLARTTVSWISAGQTRGPASEGLYDLVISRAEVTVPRDHPGAVQVAEMWRTPRDGPGEPEKFIDATAGYLGGRIGDDVFDVAGRTWMTRDPLGIDAVAQRISDSDTWLHDIVSMPLEDVSHGLGLNDAASSVAEGIGGDFVLAPVDVEFGEATKVLEIVGVVAGVALGLHPLAIACTKSLAHSWVSRKITGAIKDALWDRTPSISEIEPESRLDHAPAEIQSAIDRDAPEIADAPARDPGLRAEVDPVPELGIEVDDVDHGFGSIGSAW